VVDPGDARRQRAHVAVAEVGRDGLELEHRGVEAIEVDLDPQGLEDRLDRAAAGRGVRAHLSVMK
jgi:hypothetical protein